MTIPHAVWYKLTPKVTKNTTLSITGPVNNVFAVKFQLNIPPAATITIAARLGVGMYWNTSVKNKSDRIINTEVTSPLIGDATLALLFMLERENEPVTGYRVFGLFGLFSPKMT